MRIPTHRVADEMYVSIRPGSRMTLKIEMLPPMKPDWYTFQPDCTKGLFMKMVNGVSVESGSRTVTDDSYDIAMSVPG